MSGDPMTPQQAADAIWTGAAANDRIEQWYAPIQVLIDHARAAAPEGGDEAAMAAVDGVRVPISDETRQLGAGVIVRLGEHGPLAVLLDRWEREWEVR